MCVDRDSLVSFSCLTLCLKKMQPLKSHMAYNFAKDKPNSIDFTRFEGSSSSAPEVIVTPTHHLDGDFSAIPPESTSMTSTYRFANSTSPVVLMVSADARCSLVARFFTFRLYHFFRCCGESAKMFVAGDHFNDHRVPLFSENPEKWRERHQKCMDMALAYFDSGPALGFAATPVALIYGDSMSDGALDSFISLLPPERELLRRHIWFTEEWVKDKAITTCGWINVCLSRQSLRFTNCHGSVVCSQVTFFLNNFLTALYRMYLHEPLEGDPTDSLQSFCPIFFIRHGQSEYNLEDRLGGDPDLTDAGREDARDIGVFFEREVVHNPKLFGMRDAEWEANHGFEVWCSQLHRTRNTSRPSAHVLTDGKVRVFKSLNEIHAGICEDMTNEEIREMYPHIQLFRHTDKVGFRYPNGESYRDLVRRLTPLVMDLSTSSKCTLVVGHQAVLRSMLSFFGGPPVERAVNEPCPQRAIWVCTYNRVGEPRLSQIQLPPRGQQKTTAKNWSGW